jgi:hypothetical protein
MPLVPFKAEPLKDLQARYPQALDFVYDSDAMRDSNAIRPGEVAAQLFDFEDGLRLLISLERRPQGTVLHLSSSFETESELYGFFRKETETKSPTQVMELFIEMTRRRFIELSGDAQPPPLIGMSNFIPHFVKEYEI